MLSLHIFVSSPGDVGAERGVAFAIAERLQIEFRGQVLLKTYLWERSLLRATDTFQAQILDIQQADLALFVLWARMGTPLPLEQFSRRDGSQYSSGTEYEFERARAGYEHKKTPEILCYLKTAEVRLLMKDRELRAQQVAELDAVSHFVDKWFRKSDGTFKAAFHSFEKTAQFEELLEVHLRDWIRERLEAAEVTKIPQAQWKGSPFRGLRSFDFEHALIFCGRTGLVSELLDALSRRGAAGRGFLMLTGVSGVGKSSVVNAGVLPILTRPRVVEDVIAWRRALFKPNIGDQTLLAGFASALIEQHALPELGDQSDNFGELLRDPLALTAALARALDVATKRARETNPDHGPQGGARLVVVCDQFEGIFDETVSPVDRADFCEAMRTMILTGRVWIICTLRADFYSRCAELPERFRDLFVERGGLFTAAGPRPAEIAQMIRRPAAMAGLRFERRSDSDEGLDDVLRDAASGNPTVLPLLEFTLDELWRRSAGSGVLRFHDYENLGGLQGALRIRADEEFTRLPLPVQTSLAKVLAALVHTDPTDERLILQNRASLAQFSNSLECKALIDAFVSARLFVADQGSDGTPVIGLAHEALLREWPPAVRWIEQNRETLRLRAGIAAAAALWRNSHYRESRLMVGALLKDAARLRETNPEMLTAEEHHFIERSMAMCRRLLRRLVGRNVAAGLTVVLAILLTAIGFKQITYGFSFARAIPAVWDGDRRIPISSAALSNLNASVQNLQASLEAQVAGVGHRPELNSWQVAQIWIALHGIDIGLADPGLRLREFMTDNRDSMCQCWRETEDKLPHTLATAWVLFSLARYDQAATPEEIKFVLDRQNDDGWWAMFPATPDERNASTTATAWTVLALHEQLGNKLVGSDQGTRVEEAIRKAVDWLIRRAVAGSARWTEYPPGQIFEKDIEYLAASALVIHVLHTVGASDQFHAQWLEDLPQRIPGPLEDEVAKGVVFQSKAKVTLDEVRHYPFPSMLRATVQTYANGNVRQRARALLWIESAFKRPLRAEDFHSEHWIMAETLFVLRHAKALLEQ